MPTLEQAIDAEHNAGTTTSDQKEVQLHILTDRARALDQEELEGIIQGNFQSLLAKGYSQDDADSLKELALYRINKDIPIHPFTEFSGAVGAAPY